MDDHREGLLIRDWRSSWRSCGSRALSNSFCGWLSQDCPLRLAPWGLSQGIDGYPSGAVLPMRAGLPACGRLGGGRLCVCLHLLL